MYSSILYLKDQMTLKRYMMLYGPGIMLGVKIGYGTWPQFCGAFGPEGTRGAYSEALLHSSICQLRAPRNATYFVKSSEGPNPYSGPNAP